ncbi:unnamed protein product [Sphagnum jensenii]|uniref:Uncharacterized protein n=1 Tax=Sphagnum jensenii TaxID=128206 RepID=A0ABP1BKY4_9BRYO
MGRMASMCHQITRDDQQDDDADADDVVLVDLLKILRSETGALNDQSVFYSLLQRAECNSSSSSSSSSHAWVKCWQLLQQL